jgi:hypothetical protein
VDEIRNPVTKKCKLITITTDAHSFLTTAPIYSATRTADRDAHIFLSPAPREGAGPGDVWRLLCSSLLSAAVPNCQCGISRSKDIYINTWSSLHSVIVCRWFGAWIVVAVRSYSGAHTSSRSKLVWSLFPEHRAGVTKAHGLRFVMSCLVSCFGAQEGGPQAGDLLVSPAQNWDKCLFWRFLCSSPLSAAVPNCQRGISRIVAQQGEY